jgi:hypothetical protein
MGRFQAKAADKSVLLKAITILYDGAMKTLVTLLESPRVSRSPVRLWIAPPKSSFGIKKIAPKGAIFVCGFPISFKIAA